MGCNPIGSGPGRRRGPGRSWPAGHHPIATPEGPAHDAAMKIPLPAIFTRTILLTGPACLLLLAGCETDSPRSHRDYARHSSVQVQGSVVIMDDYDYYPAYETYYSRNRREYVYRDGGTWVRRPQPQGVSIELFFAAPSVRVDFRDSPEQHHATVVRSYPRNWQRSDSNRNDQQERKADKKQDKKKSKKDKDRDDEKHDNRRDRR